MIAVTSCAIARGSTGRLRTWFWATKWSWARVRTDSMPTGPSFKAPIVP